MTSQLRLILSSSPFVSLKKRPSPATTAASYYVLAVRRQWLSGNIGHYVSLQCTLCVRGWNTLCSSSIHIKDMRQPPKGHFTSHALNSWIATVVSKAVPPRTVTSIPNTVKTFRLVVVNYKIPNALVLFTVHVFGIILYYHAQNCFWERAPARLTFAFTSTITMNTWLLIAGCIKHSCKSSPCFLILSLF